MISLVNFKNLSKDLGSHLTERFHVDKKYEEIMGLFRRYEISFWKVAKVFEKLEILLSEIDHRISKLEGKSCSMNDDISAQRNTKKHLFQDQD